MTSTSGSTYDVGSRGIGTQMGYEDINESGCYVCNWSGHLLRVPEDSVKPGRSPVICITGSEPLWVTKISDNPFIVITKARAVAADLDVSVNF